MAEADEWRGVESGIGSSGVAEGSWGSFIFWTVSTAGICHGLERGNSVRANIPEESPNVNPIWNFL